MARSLVGINIEGVEELKKKLARMSDESRSGLIDSWCQGGAFIILQAAQRLAPVLQAADPRRTPGLLRDWLRSIKSRSSKPGNVTYRVGVPGAFPFKDPDFYPAYAEYGTKTMEAQPYLRPAFDGHQAEARDYVANQADVWLKGFEE